jgi:hypothetical protein
MSNRIVGTGSVIMPSSNISINGTPRLPDANSLNFEKPRIMPPRVGKDSLLSAMESTSTSYGLLTLTAPLQKCGHVFFDRRKIDRNIGLIKPILSRVFIGGAILDWMY